MGTTTPLRLGTPAMFTDKWEGRLASIEVDEDWRVLNVGVSRGGLRRPTSVRLPFSTVVAWSGERVAFACSSEQAFAREFPPVAAPARPLSATTPVSVAGATLVGLLVEPTHRAGTDILLRIGREERRAHLRHLRWEGKTLGLTVQPEALPLYVADEELVRRVLAALSDRYLLAPEDRRTVAAAASDGVVQLRGNVRSKAAARRAAAAAAAVPGVVRVENAIVDDASLEVTAGRALDAAGLQRTAQIFVRSAWGEVTLLGRAPTVAIAEEAARVVRDLPGVRAVRSCVQIDGTSQTLAA